MAAMFGNRRARKPRISISKDDIKKAIQKANDKLKAQNKKIENTVSNAKTNLKSTQSEIKQAGKELKSITSIIDSLISECNAIDSQLLGLKSDLSSLTDKCKKKFNIEKSYGNWYTEPIAAGYNIIGFDLPICERLAKKHKTPMPFAKLNKMDLMDLLFYWFENLDEPKNMKLDTMRDFFALKAEQAHEAYSDVVDSAKLLTQFLKFHRRQSSVAKFKGAMSDK